MFFLYITSLQEHTREVHALAHHFIHYYKPKTGKLTGFTWQHIKKYENLLIALGCPRVGWYQFLFLKNKNACKQAAFSYGKSQEKERDYIFAVLRKCDGEAEVLNCLQSTLTSKMKMADINKEDMDWKRRYFTRCISGRPGDWSIDRFFTPCQGQKRNKL